MGYAISLKGAGTGSMVGVTAFQLTQAEYNAKKNYYDSLNAFIIITDTGVLDAEDVNYFNGNSGLMSTNMQDALDEVNDKLDNELQNVDIRLNQSSGEVEWRQRGADTWTPFKSGASVYPLYITASGHGERTYEGKTYEKNWSANFLGVITKNGNASPSTTDSMNELFFDDKLGSASRVANSSVSKTGNEGATYRTASCSVDVYEYTAVTNNTINICIDVDTHCKVSGYDTKYAERKYILFEKGKHAQLVSAIPSGYSLKTTLVSIYTSGEGCSVDAYAYLYTKA